jgi:hypothetical protein
LASEVSVNEQERRWEMIEWGIELMAFARYAVKEAQAKFLSQL